MSGPTNIKPGDIAAAIRELNTSAKFCRDAANSYLGQPANDAIERSINKQRHDCALERAETLERVITFLAGAQIDRQKNPPQETDHVG